MNNRVPLPAGTVLGKSFEYGIDVKLGNAWQPFRRISGWQPAYPPVTTDTTTYDDLGNTNTDVTGRGFTGAFTVQGNRSVTTGQYLPELEAILAAAKGKAEAVVLEVRCPPQACPSSRPHRTSPRSHRADPNRKS